MTAATALWLEQRVLFGRWLARLRREPLAVVALLFQPMVWLLLFGHLLAQLAQTTGSPRCQWASRSRSRATASSSRSSGSSACR
ncbi:MAG TPA: hypothetical protein VFB06_13475 [Streptosporangiaceae bacterium]|nr:hypothetical protein [Streptosporangiaceae bacterium]